MAVCNNENLPHSVKRRFKILPKIAQKNLIHIQKQISKIKLKVPANIIYGSILLQQLASTVLKLKYSKRFYMKQQILMEQTNMAKLQINMQKHEIGIV